MLGLGLGVTEQRGPLGLGAPAFAVNRFLAEGDSITFYSGSAAGFAKQYQAYRADKTVIINAQNSRSVGGPFWIGPPPEGEDTGSPNGNTLLLNRPTDIAGDYDLCATMIGTNDLATYSVANYRSRLANWSGALRASGCKVAYSPPVPLSSNQAYAGYAAWMAKYATLRADCRDPAVWGLFADYYFPMGEHPDMNLSDNATYYSGDGVHPNDSGHVKMYEVYRPAMDSLIDQSRISATAPYGSVWPASETNLVAGADIVRRFVVSGVAHTGIAAGISVSGGDAQVRLNGGTYGTAIGTGSGNGYRIYNGDVIDVRRTASALPNTPVTYDLTIGSETRTISLTTVAAVDPVAYVHGGTLTSLASSTAQNFSSVAFGAGIPVIGLTSNSNAGGATDSGPTTVTLTPTGGGTAITLTKRIEQMRGTAASRVVELWSGSATIAAGNYDIAVSRPAAAVMNAFTYGVLTGADPVPVASAGNTPAEPSQTNHATPSVTVPANGLALGLYFIEDDTTPDAVTVSAPAVELAEVVAIGTAGVGLCLASRDTTGSITFNHKTGTYARLISAWKALGS